MKEYIKKNIWLGLSLFALFLAARYWSAVERALVLVLNAAWPLILGGIIAYVVNILMGFYETHLFKKIKSKTMQKLRRPLCILLSFVSLLLIIAFIVNMIIPELWNCLTLLAQKLPGIIEIVGSFFERHFNIDQTFIDGLIAKVENIDWEETAKQLLSGLGGAVSAAVTVVGTLTSYLVTFALALAFSVYVLAGKEQLKKAAVDIIHTYLSASKRARLLKIVRTFDQSFHKFIVGQCVEAVILGVLCIIGMLLLGIPYASMIGTLVGFTALIPVAGAYIGAVVGVIMIVTISPVKAAVFMVFLVVLQQLEGNLIYPRVVGSSIGLPGILVLAAITVGGGVMGIGGMLLSVPITAALYQLISEDISRRRREKRAGDEICDDIPDAVSCHEPEIKPVMKEIPMPSKKKSVEKKKR
ncbi:MAG: AI-2E family transporter [Clostridiaceae bacterium]|nr:AI-2E family transporter [Clostridiaceae bacterium]